jgi:two-component system, NtrC family, response regulator HydG
MNERNYKERILVVDDAVDTLEVIHRNLSSKGYQTYTAQSVNDALEILEEISIDLVITDYKMPWVSGLDLVRHVRENHRDTEVVMITGYASIPGAVDAVKSGAVDYLAKPFTDEELFGMVKKALENLRVRRASHPLEETQTPKEFGLIGESKALQKVIHGIKKTSASSATVLISGESGTGKELVARAIHYNSSRASASFVPVNCGGIPEGLLESELFGHIKGAFTGASETRAGFFQTADGGTIFLDEISETSLAMQVKLLRVLQDKEVVMVGDTRSRKVDIRILAATNRDLRSLVKKGLFREDLFFRISVITLLVPSLRERENDILLLIRHFAKKFADELDKPIPRFSDKALNAMKQYYWPGNVRELENIVQRLIVMADRDWVDVLDLPQLMRFTAVRKTGYDRTLEDIEFAYINEVLAGVNGNKTKASDILGIDRKTLREKLKKMNEKEN